MDLFNPDTYRAVRRPVTEAETLPIECYTSQEFFDREVTNIFLKCWNCVGRTDFAKNPGDYFTQTLAGVSFIVIRDKDNRLRAFVNSCRHRGAKLLEGKGHCQTINCPYHGWSYHTDGTLRAFNAMEEARNLRAEEFGLTEIKLETWLSFIFINFDANCGSLKSYLGTLNDHTESYRFEDMVTTHHKEFMVRTNWKSYVENSIEPIHLPLVHRRTIGHVFASGKAGWVLIDGTPGNFGILHTITDRSRAVLQDDEGFPPMQGLTGTAAEGAQYILVNPCTVIGGDLDCMWFKHMTPEGPNMVRNIASFCFPRSVVERPDFEKIAANYYRRGDLVIGEDSAIAETQYAGIRNPLARPGRFSHFEKLVHLFDNWVIDQVVGRPSAQQRVAAE